MAISESKQNPDNRNLITRRSALRSTAMLATLPAGAAVAAVPAAPPVRMTGDAPLFELIEAYRVTVEHFRALVTATGKPLRELGYSIRHGSRYPLQDIEGEIYAYQPVESVAGALALLGMPEEFARNRFELERRNPRHHGDPAQNYLHCQGPAVNARPILEALAGLHA